LVEYKKNLHLPALAHSLSSFWRDHRSGRTDSDYRGCLFNRQLCHVCFCARAVSTIYIIYIVNTSDTMVCHGRTVRPVDALYEAKLSSMEQLIIFCSFVQVSSFLGRKQEIVLLSIFQNSALIYTQQDILIKTMLQFQKLILESHYT
jgi:hypothetical protein